MPDPFSWFMYVPAIGDDHERLAIAHSWLVVAFLTLLALIVSSKIKKASAEMKQEDLVPEDHLTLRHGFEIYVEMLLEMMENMLGHDAQKYFWLVGTIFIYVFFSNLLGLIPGLLPPTENINTNAAVAIIVFVVYNAIGIKTHGAGYIKQFLGPMMALAPLMLVIELVSHLVRPVTLSLRLFGNINGDHIVLTIFSQLVPDIFAPILGLGIPVIFLALGLFVCFMQAFVFSLLSTVYISFAVSHDH